MGANDREGEEATGGDLDGPSLPRPGERRKWLGLLLETFEEQLLRSRIGFRIQTLLKLPRAIRSLGGGTRLIASAALLLLALLVLATRVLPAAPEWFASITWSSQGERFSLPRVALYLTLIGWAFSGALVLTGASRWSMGLLIGAGAVQLLAIVFAAFPGGKGYWMAVPGWLLAVTAAMSPAWEKSQSVRGIVTLLLCGLATWQTYLFTPLSAGGRPANWTLLLAIFAASALALLRVPWRLTVAGSFLLAFAGNGAVLLLGSRAGEVAMAGGLKVPADFLLGLFSVLWFVLGGGMVGGAVASADFAIRVAAATVLERVMPVVLCVLWLGETCLAPWLMSRASLETAIALSIHRWVAAALLVTGIALAVRRRFTEGWTRALLAVWAFSFAALRAYFSGAVGVAAYHDAHEVETVALTFFAIGIAMQVVRILIALPEGQGRSRVPEGRLLFRLGALVFLAAGTQFQFAIGNTEVMKESAVYQFAGASALFLPLLLAWAVTEQRWLPAPSRRLLVRAFLLGFIASFPVQLLRIWTYGPGGWGLAGHLGAVALGDAVKLACIASVVFTCKAGGRLEAIAVAGACALGLGVGYGQDLIVLTLDAAAKVVLMVTYPGATVSAAVNAAVSSLVTGFVRIRGALPAADHLHLLFSGLLPAAIFGAAIGRGAREGRWGRSLLAVAMGVALSQGLACAAHLHPLLRIESRLPLPFNLLVVDPAALGLILLPLMGLGAVLYGAVWRPGRLAIAGGGAGAEAEPKAAGPSNPIRGALAVGAVSAAIAGAGIALAIASPPPFLEYRDPQGRFTIGYPKEWQVQAPATGETRFYLDDPENGPSLVVLPGMVLPPGTTAAQVVRAIEAQLRSLYQDVELSAQESPARTEKGRSTQEVEVSASWTKPGTGRFRARSAVTLSCVPAGCSLSYVSCQVPEGSSASLEGLLRDMMRSYRAGAGP